MFYKMISNARNRWLMSDQCTVKDLFAYIETAGQMRDAQSDDEKDRQANELRNLIGKLPGLAIFIDEVHHAVSDEIKLRAVVNQWNRSFNFGDINFAHFSFKPRSNVTNVIGFSGTPYLKKAEKITVTDRLTAATAEITNIVYYYPLADGVGNFLKRPVVKIADSADSGRIIENGVREFLDTYKINY